MPKYYCQSGSFKNITNAIDPLTAAKKTLRKIMDTETDLGLLLIMNEKGFGCKTENLVSPTLPILRLMDIHLGDTEDLERLICASLKINRNEISEKELNWLITGDLEEGEDNVTKN